MELEEEEKSTLAKKVFEAKSLEETPIKVLVVEDDQSQWPMWSNILGALKRKTEIDWETSAEGAQGYIRQAYQENRPYDLVISDVYLEGQGTGTDLWNKYGEAAENFIFVTGSSLSKDDFFLELNYGHPEFIQKPLSIEKCKKLIKSLYDE